MSDLKQHLEQLADVDGELAVQTKTENRVSSIVQDDKKRVMGTVVVEHGTITIDLEYVPTMCDQDHTEAFLIKTIGKTLLVCFRRMPEAFEAYSRS